MNVSAAANKVIDLAGKVRDYYETELPKRHPNYPLVGPNDASVPPPAEEKALSDFLAMLSEETIYQLMLIAYLGRGEFGMEDLALEYERLKDAFGDPAQAASEMMDYASLADYLSDGLAELRKHNINADKMPLKKLKARKP